MTPEFGITLAVITLGSCVASYWAGRHEESARWQAWLRRRREREMRWEEFDDAE